MVNSFGSVIDNLSTKRLPVLGNVSRMPPQAPAPVISAGRPGELVGVARRPHFAIGLALWGRFCFACLLWAVLVAPMASAAQDENLHGKLVVGFQGWFLCPDDGRPHGGWWHWFGDNRPDAKHLHVELMPDVSELSSQSDCLTDLTKGDGQRIGLFSDYDPETVTRQFTWMRDYGIDAAALQRFLVDIDPEHPVLGRPTADHVLMNVRKASEQTGVAFFVMYDIAGGNPDRWADVLLDDWKRQLRSGLTSGPTYQRHAGHPVLAIAGVGSSDRPGTAEQMIDLVTRLRKASEAFGGVTLLASTATGWRTLDHDSKHDPLWAKAYGSFDILSPWTVGRYRDAETFDRYVKERLVPDIAEAKRIGVEYMPVVFPGFSWHNLNAVNGHTKFAYNQIPRDCGRFLWMQAARNRIEGANMLYGAMFDEVDEGTALFKLESREAELPQGVHTVPLDADGCHLNNDFYLGLSGAIARMLKANATPQSEMPIFPP